MSHVFAMVKTKELSMNATNKMVDLRQAWEAESAIGEQLGVKRPTVWPVTWTWNTYKTTDNLPWSVAPCKTFSSGFKRSQEWWKNKSQNHTGVRGQWPAKSWDPSNKDYYQQHNTPPSTQILQRQMCLPVLWGVHVQVCLKFAEHLDYPEEDWGILYGQIKPKYKFHVNKLACLVWRRNNL